MMVTVPHELVYISAQSLSGAVMDVSSVHVPNGVHLPNTDVGQQLPWLVDRSKIQQNAQELQEVQYSFQSVPPKRNGSPQYKCHLDSQKRVVCQQEAVNLELTHRQQALRQRPFVDTQKNDVRQHRNRKRVVRQVSENHQNGHQQGPPQSDRAQQGVPQSNGIQQQDPPQSNGAQQGPPQSNGAQQGPPQPSGEQQRTPQPLCPDTVCSCRGVSQVVQADCSDRELHQPPAGLHPNTTWLFLCGNNLQQLGNDSLAALNRVMLLYLNSSNINDVDEDAFSTMSNLRVLDLSHNQLSALPSTVFRSNGKLLKLDLSNNPLHLAGGHLVDSESLYWLNLSHCGLSNLPVDSFKGVPQLVMLDLSENQLTVPTALALESLSGLQRLPLVGNPLSCCEVKELLAWAVTKQLWVHRRDLDKGPLPECAAPPELAGRPWTADTGNEACDGSPGVALVAGCVLLALLLVALLVAAAILLVRRRRRAARRRRTHSALRRQEYQMGQGDAGLYEPPPVASAKDLSLGCSGPPGWDQRRPSGPRYVPSWGKAAHRPTVYDDAVGRRPQRVGPAPRTAGARAVHVARVRRRCGRGAPVAAVRLHPGPRRQALPGPGGAPKPHRQAPAPLLRALRARGLRLLRGGLSLAQRCLRPRLSQDPLVGPQSNGLHTQADRCANSLAERIIPDPHICVWGKGSWSSLWFGCVDFYW